MSQSDATRFLADLTSGKLVIDATEILSKGSHADMHEYAKSFGYDFTKEEILEAVKQQEIFDSELTEEDMEAISGGKHHKGGTGITGSDIEAGAKQYEVAEAAGVGSAAAASCL